MFSVFIIIIGVRVEGLTGLGLELQGTVAIESGVGLSDWSV